MAGSILRQIKDAVDLAIKIKSLYDKLIKHL
jgi:hypothetical protein